MQRSIAQTSLWIAALIVVVAAAGCDVQLYKAEETISEVYSTGSKPRIIVESFNGSIDISSGTTSEVVAEVTRHARGHSEDAARDNLARVEVSIKQNDNEILVRAQRSGMFGDCGASVIIVAPPESEVVLKSSNGYIVSKGLKGPIDAATSNAKIEVVEAEGHPLNLATSNGALLIEADGAAVDAKTSNASIKFRGTLAGDDNELKTSNGSIDVELPADSQFEIKATTSNARVDSDFAVKNDDDDDDNGHRRKRQRRLEGTVGKDPQFSLELATSNASIEVNKLDDDE
jgi:DUF4097 and DUF4098 domain-containing protein YvlB